MLKMLYAEKNGQIKEINIWPVGRSGITDVLLSPKDLIVMPKGTELVFLPQRLAMGAGINQIETISDDKFAVAAVLPVGYTRLLLPSSIKQKEAPVLPLKSYTAVASKNGQIYVAATKSTDSLKWQNEYYNTKILNLRVEKIRKKYVDNRILQKLATCALEWGCFTAQNIFYQRWEGGLPTSPVCNANCIACISLQPAECCPAPQERIDFVPRVEEVVEVALEHLENAKEAIISFGQGCEGEPSLQADLIAESIFKIREKTKKGCINVNTNAGFTEGVKKIVDAGVDNLRVSMISARQMVFEKYYRADYSLENVKKSIYYAKEKNIIVSINMLMYPGINDTIKESDAWYDFLAKYKIDAVQLRNLNIDMQVMENLISQSEWLELGLSLGVKKFISKMNKSVPQIKIGSFTEI